MHRDEALAIMVARRPLGELLETVQLVRGGAPLHFLLVALVERAGGGLTAARLLSAIAACVAVVAIALLGRALFGPIEGVVAAAGLAACPVALYYGQFARMYALFLAVTALALWCLVRALDVGGRWWAGAAVLLALDVYVHPYGVVVGIAAGVAVLVATLRRHETRAVARAAPDRARHRARDAAAGRRLPRARLAPRRRAHAERVAAAHAADARHGAPGVRELLRGAPRRRAADADRACTPSSSARSCWSGSRSPHGAIRPTACCWGCCWCCRRS